MKEKEKPRNTLGVVYSCNWKYEEHYLYLINDRGVREGGERRIGVIASE